MRFFTKGKCSCPGEGNSVTCVKQNQNVLFEKGGTHSVLTFGSSAVPQGKQAENNLYGVLVNQEWTVRWVEYTFN